MTRLPIRASALLAALIILLCLPSLSTAQLSVTHTKVSAAPCTADPDDIDACDWNAAHALSGINALASGGTGANLSSTGGANQIVRQSTLGGAFTVSALAAADIPALNLIASGLTINRCVEVDGAGLLTVAADVCGTPAGVVDHDLVSATHIVTGLTPGHILTALTSNTFGFAAPATHAASHEDGGADEISVLGLSGLLADPQTPLAHVHAAADTTSGTFDPARLPNPSATTLGGVRSILCGGTDKLSAIGTDGIPVCSADDGGGGGLANAYVQMTDGTITSAAAGGDIFKFRSADNKLTTAVQSNDATHGDNLLLTINEANLVLSAMGGAVTDAQVPDDITVDLATLATTATLADTATTALSGDSATGFFPSGVLEVARGGTGFSSGISGGVVYFSGAGTLSATAALGANLPLIGGGAGAIGTGTRSGNTTQFASVTGTKTTGKQLAFDASGNVIASPDDLVTQAALDAKQPLDADLTSWAGVTRAAGIDTFVTTPTAANFAAAVTDSAKLGWTKYTIAETALTTASTTEDETLFACAQFCKIEYVVVKHSAAFTGGTISEMTVQVVPASGTAYTAAHDIFQSIGDTVFQDSNTFGSATMVAAGHNVIARFTAVGDNVVNATAGSVDIWVKVSTLP